MELLGTPFPLYQIVPPPGGPGGPGGPGAPAGPGGPSISPRMVVVDVTRAP